MNTCLGKTEPKKECEKIDFSGTRVLLVDDNELNREIAVEMLNQTGTQIETAENGAIALRMVSENGADYYDCVLMDIQMPVMDGYKASAEIRKLPFGKDLPIIAFSANVFEEDKKSATEGRKSNAVVTFDSGGDKPPLHTGDVITISQLKEKKSSTLSILHRPLFATKSNNRNPLIYKAFRGSLIALQNGERLQ